MRYFVLCLCVLFGTSLPIAAKDFATMFPELQDIDPDLKSDLEKLDYQQGEISIGRGIATFNVGEQYYFLNANDAQTVLEDFWGNPPDDTPLGMLFEVGSTPYHNEVWGLVIMFEEIGYVSDEDANDYDYDELLQTMQSDTRETNTRRIEQGYGAIELMGWAEVPHYDQATRKLYWAKDLIFDGDAENHVLNYEIRALGRKGVLVMNFIAGMDALPAVKDAATDVLAMSNFTEGNKYSDFNPSIDTVAAIGIGGLIAGKVVAKTGLLIGLLLMFKKFAILLLLPLAWVWKKLTGGSRNS